MTYGPADPGGEVEGWVGHVHARRAEEVAMLADVGDRLVVRSTHVDGPVRNGEIIEVRHTDGSPPYVVRWSDSGQEALVYPGPDAYVEHLSRGE
jgi:hypothetical protein